MTDLMPPRPLREDDERTTFDCGRPSLDHWLRRHAWGNQRSGASRTNVICDAATGSIAGYVALSVGQIERGYLPKFAQRNQPDPIPVILLGQLAVDRRFQGQGCARSLLHFALSTAVRVSAEIGVFAVLTHPLDDDLRNFYGRFGFTDLPGDPQRSMAVRIIDLQASGLNP
jgi:predicted N-acetyltransferase YhbS